MKKIPTLTVFTAFLLMSLSFLTTISSAQAAVIGGQINSADLSLVLGVEEASGYKAMMGATPDGYSIGSGRAANRLIVVDYTGSYWVSSRDFSDAHGMTVALPTNGNDKIVYLNSRGYISGGMGLSESEVAQVVSYYQLSSLTPYLRYLAPEAQFDLHRSVYEARMALPIDREVTSRDVDNYVYEVGRLGGETAGQAVSSILDAAATSTAVPDFGAGTLGTDLVYAQDVMMSLGLDWVSSVDNGGGGKGLVASGWSTYGPSLPEVTGLDAHTDGSFIFPY